MRLRGIDTPESRARCDIEYSLAITARDYVRVLVGQRVLLVDVQPDKHAGRLVANVTLANGLDLSEHLLSLGYARAYEGASRDVVR
ncbi:MAG: thermonuclease family protein [Gemmatimonadetes bacterium]|nr:thermonuclease family protein [Gemmatimonadota bacterium]